MGSSNTKNQVFNIPLKEIEALCLANPTLDSQFEEAKGSAKGMDLNDFKQLVPNLKPKLAKRIFKVATEDQKLMNIAQFRYFYALVTSRDVSKKAILVSSLIFTRHDQMKNSKYKKRLKGIFSVYDPTYRFLEEQPSFSDETVKDIKVENELQKFPRLVEIFTFNESTSCNCPVRGLSKKMSAVGGFVSS